MLGSFTVFHLYIFSFIFFGNWFNTKSMWVCSKRMVLYFIQKHKKLPHNHTIHTETVQSDNMDRPAASCPPATQRHRSVASRGQWPGVHTEPSCNTTSKTLLVRWTNVDLRVLAYKSRMSNFLHVNPSQIHYLIIRKVLIVRFYITIEMIFGKVHKDSWLSS